MIIIMNIMIIGIRMNDNKVRVWYDPVRRLMIAITIDSCVDDNDNDAPSTYSNVDNRRSDRYHAIEVD
jgi:hypothetical protein